MNISSFLMLCWLTVLTACSHFSPVLTNEESFSKQFESVPDLFNDDKSKSDPDMSVVRSAVRYFAKQDQSVEFSHVVSGREFEFYAFHLEGIEDMYLTVAIRKRDRAYIFRHLGEKNPNL